MDVTKTSFSDAQLAETYPPGIEHHFWNHARNRILAATLRRAGGAAGFRRVLEIGCGRGVVVRHLRAQGFDCHGVELSPTSVDDDLIGVVQAGRDCFTLPQNERAATDCILLFDVIEHLPDPVAFLAQLRTAFPAARTLMVTVPARGELWSNYDSYYGHYRRYTTGSLRAELAGAGFDARSCGYLFHLLYPVMFLAARVMGARETVQKTPRLLPLHRLLSAVLVADYMLLPGWLPGTSVLAVAHPSSG